MRLPSSPRRAFCFALILGAAALLLTGPAVAQSGSFVIPGFRNGGGSDFAYWDLFRNQPGKTMNYNFDNAPALLDGTGMDDAGNLTTAFTDRVNLRQTGTDTCFVTSTGAIYSYMAATAFEVPYTPPASKPGEVTNVIFQTQSGGARMDLDTIRLVYEKVLPGGTQTFEVAAIYRGLDDPQTGAFSERTISAFQWDLTGLGVRNFKIKFATPSASLALWQAQIDAVIAAPFDAELGYLLFTRSRPSTRYGRAGAVDKNLPFNKDGRFFFPGDELNLMATPELDWEHVGFIYNGTFTEGYELPLTFPNGDATVTAVFVPLSYDAWRDKIFYHSNSLVGSPADNLNNVVSGPNVDYDKDGMDNLNEYAAGGDPYTPDLHRTGAKLSLMSVEGETYQVVQYRTNGAPAEYADVTMHVQVSTDMITWKDNENSPGIPISEELGRVRQSDGTEIVTARIHQPVGSLPRFFIRVAAR